MAELQIRNPKGFKPGYNSITQLGEAEDDTGIEFGILNLKADETWKIDYALESAYLLMHGKAKFEFGNQSYTVERQSIFDEEPFALHLPANCKATITADSPCEISVSQVKNSVQFEPMWFNSSNLLESEHRGKGQLNDTAYRIVRTIFDIRNRPEAKLVLGEVINFPGCWSSYPPHHHPQPEVYHYRFTKPQGFGHGELGEQVCRLKQYDTVKILDEKDHSQTAAPGYGMYYIWVIRHLENNNYTVPEFSEEHTWLLKDDADVWQPKL
jgi:5-deoxy-glucuronate isomerase